jgi:hypothetical protein
MRVKHALRIYITDAYFIFNDNYFVTTIDRIDKSPSEGHNNVELMVYRESIKKEKRLSSPLLIFSLVIKRPCGLQFYCHKKMFLSKFSLLSLLVATKVACRLVVRCCMHKRNICVT